MSKHLEHLSKTIEQLSSLGEAERAILFSEIKKIQKEVDKSEFKLSRIRKDKDIAINVLNSAIGDLEKSKLELEKANMELLRQQEKLKQQNEVIEENASRLSENLHKLEMSYQELEQFAHIASHDLKSPLRTISNFAQLLERRYHDKLDSEAKEFINYIVSGTIQMHEVICNSLEYAQVDKHNEKFVKTSLEEVMGMVLLNLKNEIEENEAVIHFSELPHIVAHQGNLIQLFQNLLGNAIKFRSEERPEIDITWRKKGEAYEFRVGDNGIGMAEIYRQKVFRPFQRLQVKDRPGSGIGLAICKKIVNLHGGEIYFESEVGKGTTFIFTLCPQTSSMLPTLRNLTEAA